MGEAELKELTRKAIAEVPFRDGANNHMGSRLTADRQRLKWVLEEFKARKLFFIDSRTTKDTVALEVAGELGVPAAQRQVFLDDDFRRAALPRATRVHLHHSVPAVAPPLFWITELMLR